MSDYPATTAGQTLTKDQMGAYIWLLIGIQRTHQDFNIDDYRHGLAKATWDVQSACAGPAAEQRNELLDQLTPAALLPATPKAHNRLPPFLTTTAPPPPPTSPPLST